MAERRNERTRIMEEVARKLSEMQCVFEVLSDEAFYNSSYGETRKLKGHDASNEIFFHVLIPGKSRDLFKVYFHKNRVAFALGKLLGDGLDAFSSDVSFAKNFFKNRYWELNIITEEPNEMYEFALQLSIDLMEHAVKLKPDFGIWKPKSGINVPLLPKEIIETPEGETHYICGNCDYEFMKAPRCPECGQLVKE